jgi:hypothetical protein
MKLVMDTYRWILEVVRRPKSCEGLCPSTQTLGCRSRSVPKAYVALVGSTGVVD